MWKSKRLNTGGMELKPQEIRNAVTLAKLGEKDRRRLLACKDKFKANLMEEMRTNRSYNNSFSGGTGKPENVRKRFARFAEILQQSMNNPK